ncbi:MAG: cupin domain-containing protein [Propionibacteriaceae bacterium]|jgi:predicted cupin superfamily sugar epimerase|nr:cupin domain-containing protein [Propionibacteriaceae bacterium]
MKPETAERLGLEPHPEGGWFRRTWESPATVEGGRRAASLIYFLLTAGEASAWHKVDADEIWLWHGPGSLVLEIKDDEDAPVSAHALDSEHAQVLVPAGAWQRTLPVAGEEVLASCLVSPEFLFDGFELG